jgi:hypothetical protein
MSNVKQCIHIAQKNSINFLKGYKCTKNAIDNSDFCDKHQYILKNKALKTSLKKTSELKNKSKKTVSFKSLPDKKSVLPIRFLKSMILKATTNHYENYDPNEFVFFRNSVIKTPQTDLEKFLQKSAQYDDQPIDEDAYVEIIDNSNDQPFNEAIQINEVQPINEVNPINEDQPINEVNPINEDEYVEEPVYDQPSVEQNDLQYLQSLELNEEEYYIEEHEVQHDEVQQFDVQQVEVQDNGNNDEKEDYRDDVHKIAQILVELGNI